MNKVPNTVPIAKMEELLMRELPKIAAAHENIIVSGPTYKGVTSIQTGLPLPMVATPSSRSAARRTSTRWSARSTATSCACSSARASL